MATVKFYLVANESDDSSIIYVSFSHGKKIRLRKSTEQKVLKKFWNDEASKVSASKFYPQYISINATLDKIRNVAMDTYRANLKNVTTALISDAIDDEVFGRGKNKASFLVFLSEHIESGIPGKSVKKWSDSKARSYIALQGNVKDYLLQYNKSDLSFEEMDIQFYEGLIYYFFNFKDLSINSVSTYISELKAVLSIALLKGYPVNICYKQVEAKPQKADRAILTDEEVDAIANLVIDKELGRTGEYVRDLFILECETSLRGYSDIMRLDISKHLVCQNNRYYLSITPQKTINTKSNADNTFIPVSERALLILNKYKVFRKCSGKTYKKYLKIICIKSGITRTVTLIKNSKGKNHAFEINIAEHILSHTGRHIYMDRKLKKGVPRDVIAGYTQIHPNTVSSYSHMKSEDYAKLLIEKYSDD